MSLLRQKYAMNEKKAVSFSSSLMRLTHISISSGQRWTSHIYQKLHDPNLIIEISNYSLNTHFVPSTQVLSLGNLKRNICENFSPFMKFVVLFERNEES